MENRLIREKDLRRKLTDLNKWDVWDFHLRSLSNCTPSSLTVLKFGVQSSLLIGNVFFF